MSFPGDLVCIVVFIPLFGVLPLHMNIVENNVFSDVRIRAAWDIHIFPISKLPPLRLQTVFKCVAEKAHVLGIPILQWVGDGRYGALMYLESVGR